jgi:uncharacterized protein
MAERMRLRRHVVVFLRAPLRGQVKRRLARAIGDGAALAFHRREATRLLRLLARDRRWLVHVAVTPDRAFLPRAWRVGARMGQGGGDLGSRMARAFARLPPGPAVLVGADIPELVPRHVAAAFAALRRHDAVFGPAEDGGYWLVGFARRATLPRGLFAAVRWSSAHALADTLASLPPRMRIALVERLADVDDEAAYRRSVIRRRRGAP